MDDFQRKKTILDQATEAIVHYLDNFTMPIVSKQHGLLGSGLCIDVDGTPIIATAGHLIADYEPDIFLLPNTTRGKIGDRVNPTIYPYEYDSQYRDWGLLTFPLDQLGRLKFNALPLEKLTCGISHVENDLVVVNGFPGQWYYDRFCQGSITFQPLCYQTVTIPLGNWPTDLDPPLNPETDIALEYPKEGNFFTKTPGPAGLPDAPGLSGGPIWSTNLNKRGPWSTANLHLIGIQVAWYPQSRILRAIKIENWLRFVVTHIPKLERAIHRRLEK